MKSAEVARSLCHLERMGTFWIRAVKQHLRPYAADDCWGFWRVPEGAVESSNERLEIRCSTQRKTYLPQTGGSFSFCAGSGLKEEGTAPNGMLIPERQKLTRYAICLEWEEIKQKERCVFCLQCVEMAQPFMSSETPSASVAGEWAKPTSSAGTCWPVRTGSGRWTAEVSMRHFAWCAAYMAVKAGEAKFLICVVFWACKSLDLCGFWLSRNLDLWWTLRQIQEIANSIQEFLYWCSVWIACSLRHR